MRNMNENIFTLYRKLTDVNAKYCSLCFSKNEESACCVQDLVVLGPNRDNDAKKSFDEEEVGIYYILQQILGTKVASHLSDYDLICNKCIQSVIAAFKFIKMCRENTESIAYALEAFTVTLEYTEAMDKQDYKTMFIIMDLEESKCTQYYDTEQFVDSSAALYKFQTLFRPFRKVLDNKGNPKYKCTKCEYVSRYQSSALKHFNVKHNKDQEISLKDEIKPSISDDDDNNLCTDDVNENASPTYWFKPYNREHVKHFNELTHEVIIDCDGVNKYKCKVCDLIYSSAQKARQHYKTKHSNGKDKTKTKKFIKPDYLTEFNYCKDNIKHLNKLSHTVFKDSCGAKKYKCKECTSILCNPYAARSHYLKYHLVETSIEEDFDSNRDDSQTETENKVGNKDIIYTCIECNEKYDSKYVLIWHLLNEHAVINSEFCRETTLEDINLLGNDIFNHIYTKERDENDMEKYCCKICLRLYKNYRSVRDHFSDTHIKPQDKKKEYVCSQCGKVLKTKQRLNRHEQRHAESKVSCETCKKVFKNKHYFKDHKCFKFERARITQSQRGVSEFICNECGKTYKTIIKLRSHMRSHVPKTVSCDLCPKVFRHRSQLKDHQVTHTKERNFICNICGGAFVAKNALVYHTRIHTGERPYKCSYCEMRFLSTSRRAHHIKRHHIAAMATCSICGITIKELGMPKHMKRHYISSSENAIGSVSLVSRKGKRKANNTESVSDCDSTV